MLRALFVSALAALLPSTTLAADASRPNIIVIMADDHGRQAISCYGSKLLQTPNIDRLARQGTRFTDAMANNSICSPSRATMLTGKYNHLCGVQKLEGHFDGSQQTFPKLLQQAGYQTAIVGKWHLYSEPTGFDFYSVLPGQGEYYNCRLKETGQPWGNPYQGGTVHQGYLTDVITDVALGWLEKRRRDRPFCLLIHHKAPHAPHCPAPRHKDLFQNTVFPEPGNLLDDYKGRAPEPVANEISWSRLIQEPEPQYKQFFAAHFTGEVEHDTRFAYQYYLRNYLRVVAALDENVGRVLDYVDVAGLAQNTAIIYTSDNGYFLGEHGFYNKMWMYEEGFHIPLLVRLPGGKAGNSNRELMSALIDAKDPWDWGSQGGRVNHELVNMIDLAPSVLDLAGVNIPPDIQGCSWKPLLTGAPVVWRDAMYYHYYGVKGKPRSDNWIAFHEIMGIRSKTAKMIFYPDWKNGPFWEFFDLTQDSHEMTNLYSDPARQAEVRAYKAKMRQLAEQYKDPDAQKIK